MPAFTRWHFARSLEDVISDREGHRVVEKLAVLEETLQFDRRALGTVRGMGDVFHHRRSKVATDRALGSFCGVGWPEKLAHTIHGVVRSQSDSDERCGSHEGFHFGEEWLRGDVSIVLAQEARIGTEHFASANLEAGVLKALQDLAGIVASDAVGFQKNQGCLHKA